MQRVLEHALVPVEEAMEAIEKAEERREEERKRALADARAAELAPFADPQHFNLRDMPDSQWQQVLAGAKAAKQAEIEAAQRAEAERQAQAVAAQQERERLQAENARLAAANVEAERAATAAKAEAWKREAEEARGEYLLLDARQQNRVRNRARRMAEKQPTPGMRRCSR